MTVPFVVLSAVLMQGSQVANSYALVWWQDKCVLSLSSRDALIRVCSTFHKPFSFYQVLYALLGIAQSIFTYALCAAPRGMPMTLTLCF